MLLPRILPFTILVVSLLQSSLCEDQSLESSESKAVKDSSFEKRQGLADEVPDQLAVESGHQEQVETHVNPEGYGQQVPAPLAVHAFPGNVVLPMPPGFGQGPPPQGFRGPIPQPNGPHNIQGQYSQPQPAVQGPPQQFQQQQGPPQQFQQQGPPQQFQQQGPPQQFQHQGPPPHQQFQQGPPPPHQFPQQGPPPPQFHHQQPPPQFNPQNHPHHQSLQEQLRSKLPTGTEILVQKANEVVPSGHQKAQSQESQHQIHIVPGLDPQQFQNQQHLHIQQNQNNLAHAQQQAHAQSQQSQSSNSGEQSQIHPNHKNTGLLPPHPRQRPGYNSGESLTKNILRELFSRPKPQPHHDLPHGKPTPPNGGFFGPPPPPPPGPSHPKVLNRPNQLQGIRPPGGITNGKEVALSNDLNAEGGEVGPIVQYGAPLAAGPAGAWPEGPDGDMPKIVSLEVKCEKNVMRVFVAFDKPFYGVIFSKGHYHNVHCVHLPAGLGHTSANFDIGIDSCGTQGNTENGLYGYGAASGSGSYFENTIVVQYDSQVQEVWDQARKLRCTWHDQYEKSVTFRPFPVDMLDVVRADFAGDNVGCWMQIQVGKGPWASEVSGLVKIGQTMTMVLAIKDDENKFDMLVRNCMAHDGNRAPIQLVDQWGCVTRPKLMSRFTKIKNFGNSASVLSYAHFQAFKFPDSMEVHFQCTIQICRHQCPEQCTQGGAAGAYGLGKSGLAGEASEQNEARAAGDNAATRRKRRSPGHNSTTEAVMSDDDTFEYTTTFKAEINQKEDVGLNRVITVVSPDDLDFSNKQGAGESNEEGVPVIEASVGNIVCMSTFGFAAMLVLLIGMLLVACIVSAVIILKRPSKKGY